jgi:hypothetical protein
MEMAVLLLTFTLKAQLILNIRVYCGSVKSSVFWDIKHVVPLKDYLRFEGIYSLHLQVGRIIQTRNPHEAGSKKHVIRESKGKVKLSL